MTHKVTHGKGNVGAKILYGKTCAHAAAANIGVAESVWSLAARSNPHP